MTPDGKFIVKIHLGLRGLNCNFILTNVSIEITVKHVLVKGTFGSSL